MKDPMEEAFFTRSSGSHNLILTLGSNTVSRDYNMTHEKESDGFICPPGAEARARPVGSQVVLSIPGHSALQHAVQLQRGSSQHELAAHD